MGRTAAGASRRYWSGAACRLAPPYCACAVGLWTADAGARSPGRSNRAQDYGRAAGAVAVDAWLDRSARLGPAPLVVWAYRGGAGHVKLVTSADGYVVETIGANTSCPATATAPAGEGICRRRRDLHPGVAWRPRSVVPVRY